jgi:hypothetical protein
MPRPPLTSPPIATKELDPVTSSEPPTHELGGEAATRPISPGTGKWTKSMASPIAALGRRRAVHPGVGATSLALPELQHNRMPVLVGTRQEPSRVVVRRDEPPPPSRCAPGSYQAAGPPPLQMRTQGRRIRHHHDPGSPPRLLRLDELAVAAPAAPAISPPPTNSQLPSASGPAAAAARAGGSGGEGSWCWGRLLAARWMLPVPPWGRHEET